MSAAGSVMIYVTIPKASEITGYTQAAIKQKVARGVWVKGREWRKASNGRRLIDVPAVAAWVERGPA